MLQLVGVATHCSAAMTHVHAGSWMGAPCVWTTFIRCVQRSLRGSRSGGRLNIAQQFGRCERFKRLEDVWRYGDVRAGVIGARAVCAVASVNNDVDAL